MTEAALVLSEQKVQKLGSHLATVEREQRSLAQKQANEHRLQQQVGSWQAGGSRQAAATEEQVPGCPPWFLKQEAAERESKLLKDLSTASEQNLQLRNQVWGAWAPWVVVRGRAGLRGTGSALLLPWVLPPQVDALERKTKCQQEQLFQARQELTDRTAELKIQALQAEGGHAAARWVGWWARHVALSPVLPGFRAPGDGEEAFPPESGRLGPSALQGGTWAPWSALSTRPHSGATVLGGPAIHTGNCGCWGWSRL